MSASQYPHMTLAGWHAYIEQTGRNAFDEAAECGERKFARQQYGIGDFPFPGDEEDVARNGGWVRFVSGWHYDYVAAGS